MSYQQQQKTPFCALTIKMYATGKTAPKFEFKANAESLFTCICIIVCIIIKF